MEMKKLFDRVEAAEVRIADHERAMDEQLDIIEAGEKKFKIAIVVGGCALAAIGIYALVTRGKLKALKGAVKSSNKMMKFDIGELQLADRLLNEASSGNVDPSIAAKIFELKVSDIAESAAKVTAEVIAEDYITDSIQDVASRTASTVASSIAHTVGATAGRGAALEYSLGLH